MEIILGGCKSRRSGRKDREAKVIGVMIMMDDPRKGDSREGGVG